MARQAIERRLERIIALLTQGQAQYRFPHSDFVSDEFSLSRLTDSLSENRANSMFPLINEPTLEIRDTEQSHHLKI